MIYRVFVILLFIPILSFSQKYPLQYIDTKTDASFRGLSVADENAVWVSGSKGWVGRTTDGGVNWTFGQVAGYEKCDFRSLYAMDSNTAIIANAGAPSYVLRTSDGGRSWIKVYENRDSAVFLDGIDLWDYPLSFLGGRARKRGMIHGDPVKGRMFLLYTSDAGKTWKERRGPQMKEGQASFAASGTSICCFGKRMVAVASGGKASDLYISNNKGRRWKVVQTPMLSGKESTGIFSFMMAWPGQRHWLIAGGDYRDDTLRTANFFYTTDRGQTWQAPVKTTRGYRECLASINRGLPRKPGGLTTTFAVGPSGIDMSDDGGKTWQPFSDAKGFHVIKRGVGKRCLYLAGANGKLAMIRPESRSLR